MLEEGFVDTESFRKGGWVTDLKYMDELIDMVKERQKVDKKKKLKRVTLRRYASVSPSAFGLEAGKVIAIIRASGTITGVRSAACPVFLSMLSNGQLCHQHLRVSIRMCCNARPSHMLGHVCDRNQAPWCFGAVCGLHWQAYFMKGQKRSNG